MIYYLKNILPKIKAYSHALDNKSLLVNKPWVLIDPKGKYHKYIFKKDGELIYSKEGHALTGRWELIPEANSLFIDRDGEKFLLNQGFVDPAILVLKIDGTNEDYHILANEKRIPDLNIEAYLREIYYEKYDVMPQKLYNNKILEICYSERSYYPKNITIDGENVVDGRYVSKSQRVTYVVKNKYLVEKENNIVWEFENIGELEFPMLKREQNEPIVGNRVYRLGRVIQDGKYTEKKKKCKFIISNGKVMQKYWEYKYQLNIGETIIIKQKKQDKLSKHDQANYHMGSYVKDGKYILNRNCRVKIKDGKIIRIRNQKSLQKQS